MERMGVFRSSVVVFKKKKKSLAELWREYLYIVA